MNRLLPRLKMAKASTAVKAILRPILTPDPAPEYVITIGAGRAVSYLLFDPDELNGTAEAPEPPSGGNEGGEPGGEPTTLATKEGEGEAVLTLYGKYVSAYEALIEKSQ